MKDFFHQRGQILEEMYEWIKNMYRAENERPVIVIGNFTEKDYAFLKIVYHVFCLTKKPSADNPEMKAILDLNPSLAATIGIKNAYNSKDSLYEIL